MLAADIGSGRVPYEVSEPWEYLPSVLHPSLGAADDPLARIGSARWVTAMPPPRHLGAHTVILLYTEVCFWATGPAHVGDFVPFYQCLTYTGERSARIVDRPLTCVS